MIFTKTVYKLGARARDRSARDIPQRCHQKQKPAGVNDPNRENFLITEQACVECGARSWAVPVLSGAGWYVSPFCHVCVGRDEEIANRRALEDYERNVKQRYLNAGLTEHDIRSDYPLLEGLKALITKGAQWVSYLVGTSGTGKTTQGIACAKWHIEAGYRVKYLTEGDLALLLRPDGGLTLKDLLNLDLLIIDEFGSDSRTEWATQQVKMTIDGRYRHRKPTVLLSNHSIRTIAKRQGLGRPIAERIYEGLNGIEGLLNSAQYYQFTFSHRIGRPVALPEGCPRGSS